MNTPSISRERYDTADKEKLKYKSQAGLNEELVRHISTSKKEPTWMLEKRLSALKKYEEASLPSWGPNLEKLDLENLSYFIQADAKRNRTSWEDVPEEIKNTFERLGIPEAERKALAGTGAQYESEVVYHHLKKELAEQGVIFLDMDVALQEQEELVKQYFGKAVPASDHTFMLLHTAVWSGGTFIYIPKGVRVEQPLQAYFRMNSERGGQFEHTIIIVEEEAQGYYIEGCSAPKYNSSSLHAGCVELFVKKNATLRYASVENWSENTYNLNTKRAIVDEDGRIEWVGGNLGSGCTMLYPCSILKGDRSQSEHLGISFSAERQNQDTGAKVIHLGKETKSTIVAKSIAKNGGIASYRGLVKIGKKARGAQTHVECDSLMIGVGSVSNTIPIIEVSNKSSIVGHEARVGKIGEEQLFYLQSRGLSEEEATQMIISGFIAPIIKELPLEYALELNKLIAMEMEGSVG